MTTYGAQMDRKWTGSGLEVTGSGLEVSICPSVHPKHFPYLLDEPYARDLQAQGACALRFFTNKFEFQIKTIFSKNPTIKKLDFWIQAFWGSKMRYIFKKSQGASALRL